MDFKWFGSACLSKKEELLELSNSRSNGEEDALETIVFLAMSPAFPASGSPGTASLLLLLVAVIAVLLDAAAAARQLPGLSSNVILLHEQELWGPLVPWIELSQRRSHAVVAPRILADEEGEILVQRR